MKLNHVRRPEIPTLNDLLSAFADRAFFISTKKGLDLISFDLPLEHCISELLSSGKTFHSQIGTVRFHLNLGCVS